MNNLQRQQYTHAGINKTRVFITPCSKMHHQHHPAFRPEGGSFVCIAEGGMIGGYDATSLPELLVFVIFFRFAILRFVLF